MSGRDAFSAWAALAVQVAELVALRDDGVTAFIIDPAQPELPSREARSTTDLHAAHVGAQVVVLLEGGDPARPIIIGVLRGGAQRPPGMRVESDGERLVVRAKHQLVLRCGKASITLTEAGKVLIEGSYILSRATGVNRLKGGSVQLN